MRFDDLREPRVQFPFRQGLQEGQIDDHGGRLVKRSDGVLAKGVIDARFPAYAGIDLRHDGRWDLYESDPAHETCGREPGHVAGHPATQGYHDARPVQPCFEEHPAEFLDACELFGFFSGRHDAQHRREPGRTHEAQDLLSMDFGHIGVGAHGDRALCPQPRQFRGQLAQGILANVDRISPVSESQGQGFH